jgi:NTE family protein
MAKKKITLVMGGGTKCLSYIGVLRVLEAKGMEISEYVGTSMGALIASLAASGVSSIDMTKIAMPLAKKDFLDLNLSELLLYQTKANSVFKGEKLADFIRKLIPISDFRKLPKPLFINSVDLVTGSNIFFGSSGYEDVPIPDAVYASCAIPGVFSPKKIGEAYFVDGGVVDNLPIRFAESREPDLIIAVIPSIKAFPDRWDIETSGGIVATVLRTNSMMIRAMLASQVKNCSKPLILIEPDLTDTQLFSFENINKMIFRGEHAAAKILENHPILREGGIWDFIKKKFTSDE